MMRLNPMRRNPTYVSMGHSTPSLSRSKKATCCWRQQRVGCQLSAVLRMLMKQAHRMELEVWICWLVL
jgi:hypothetical protein